MRGDSIPRLPIVRALSSKCASLCSLAALLFVAGSMAQSLLEIEWQDLTEAAPAIMTALMMPFSFSIADGIGLGFISFVLIKAVSGRKQDIPLALWIIAAVFAAKFALL